MKNEAYSAALNDALAEIKNICPDVQASFIFDKEGAIIAADTKTPEVPYEKTVEAVEKLLTKTETIEGLSTLVINAQKGKVYITHENDFFHAWITTENVDMAYLRTVSRVLIPTLMKLMDRIPTDPVQSSVELQSSEPSLMKPKGKVEQEEIAEEEFAEEEEETEEELEGRIDEEPAELDAERPKRSSLPPARAPPQELHPPSSQLVVDTLNGLLVRGDTVQVDPELLNEWSEYYDGVEVNQVEIKSFNGNSTVCKVKPIKDSRIEGKGVIRIPERGCQDLDVRKGEMVKVKPLMEEE